MQGHMPLNCARHDVDHISERASDLSILKNVFVILKSNYVSIKISAFTYLYLSDYAKCY